MGSHLVADLQLGMVESYRDIPRILVEHNYVPSALGEVWVEMIGFRNILVHDYLDIDRELVYRLYRTTDDGQQTTRIALPLSPDRGPSSIVHGPSSASDDRRRTTDDPERSPALARPQTVVHRLWSIVCLRTTDDRRQTADDSQQPALSVAEGSIVRGPSSVFGR
jgi:hypothetical protein